MLWAKKLLCKKKNIEKEKRFIYNASNIKTKFTVNKTFKF